MAVGADADKNFQTQSREQIGAVKKEFSVQFRAHRSYSLSMS